MPETRGTTVPPTQPADDPIRRLLAALGDWGVAEVNGAPPNTLEHLADIALKAYEEVSPAA